MSRASECPRFFSRHLAEGFEADVVRLIEQQLSVLERTGQIEPTHHLMPTKRLFQRESLVSAAYKPVVASFLKDPLGRVPHEIDGASDQIKEELESAARWTTSQRLAQVEKLIAEATRDLVMEDLHDRI
ncbi:hypothetical protein BMF94_1106 [Rhodotorula taiwanensis]|uniref:Uncharacterized protein n=1 Tax=Rhodotorula taiwanensis TaxID=741276 RepID=A0A2S5BGC4_9BASI|nr:hypothetical protein BMF94_1106 [Rhodotorula taiwanensis]